MNGLRWRLPLIVGMLLAAFPTSSTFAQSGPCTPPVTNPIACENTLAGNPSTEWDVTGAGDPSIQGYATDISYNAGQTATFKVRTDAAAYRLDIYRMGFYGGAGARRVATVRPTITLPQLQPACLSDPTTGLVDCGNWGVSVQWAIPTGAVSGIYFARLVREDPTAASSHLIFVVRDDTGGSPLLFQTSDTSWQAYNSYGGNSLYTGSPAGRAFKVSYNRPFNNRANIGGPRETWVFGAEYPMVRWLEANGYNVSYSTGVDTDRRGAELLEHRVFLSVGHDEYWSGAQRANVEAARAAGVNLAFFSGNEVFWKTRWENSIDGSGTANRTLVSYKETHANAVIDPADPPIWTGTWRDPRFSPPADGGRPENALTGTLFTVNAGNTTSIAVTAADGRMRLWRNTNIASLAPGSSTTLASGTLGYEWDEDTDNGSRPPGSVRLSTTEVNVVNQLRNYGSTYGPGTARHHLTLYRHSSGALVFGAGTVQWSWGLDSNHDGVNGATDARQQQATLNLLADMGVQPSTIQSGLVAASASTDTIAPTSTITSPTGGSTVPIGLPVTIAGTAADTGGGVVGGVEVSVDGGTTWHPAVGRESWTYTWAPITTGAVAIRSRAVDDSANLGAASSPISVTVAACSNCGSALNLNGTTAWAQAPNNAEISGTSSWTVEAWFKDASPTGYAHPRTFILSKGDTSNAEVPYFLYVEDNGLYAGVRTGGSSSSVRYELTGHSVTANTWHHAAVSLDTTTRLLTLYLDGTQVAQTTLPATSQIGNSLPLNFGDNGPAGEFWRGSIDDVRFWTIVRTSADIQSTYRAELGNATPGLVSNWRFDEGSGTSAADAAGVREDATLQGGAGWTTGAVPAPPPDNTGPVISGVQATGITGSTATIVWNTDEGADSQVEYGTTAAYGSTTPLDSTLVSNHAVGVGGLSPNTLYHYRVSSRDFSGNPTTSGDSTFTTPSSGSVPSSVNLDGTTGYVTVPTASEIDITGDWTVELWFKDETPGGYNHGRTRLVSKGDANNLEIPYFISIETNGLFAGLRTSGSTSVLRADLTGVTANAWHHVAATYRSSTRLATLYLDGVQVNQSGLAGVSSGNSDPLSIGRNGTAGSADGFFWRGKLDDVRVWNVVRTTAEIQSTFQTEITAAPASLVGYWRFNEGTGLTAADNGGTPQNGTLVGGATFSSDTVIAPPATATATATPTNTATATARATATATATATHTPTATATATPTNTATALPTNTSTATAVPTNTPTATAIPTNTPTATAVPTNTPTATRTPTATATSVATATPGAGNTVTPTATASSTPTSVPADTSTLTAVPTNTSTAVPTDTSAPTAVPTDTPAPTNTATAVPTNTPTATAVPTNTPTTAPTSTATAVPTAGGPSSLLLNGTTAYAEAPDAAELNTTGDWTVEAWFKDETVGGYNHARTRIITKGDTSTAAQVPYFIDITTNSLSAGRKANNSFQVVSFSLATTSAGVWHHAAATYRASNSQLTLLLNGVQVAQSSAGAAVASTGNTSPVSIGRNGGATGNFWTGKLDDVRVWNTLRTPAEIAANRLVEISGSPVNLVGNWRFNEGTGATGADSGGTAQNAALLGNATWSPTDFPAPAATPTRTPTATPTRTPTATATATATPTATLVSTATPTDVATAVPTATPTPTAVPTPIPTVTGPQSLAFDGTSAYAEAPNAAELNTTSDWTIEAWFKDETPGGYNHTSRTRIITKGDTNTNADVPYFMDITLNRLAAGRKAQNSFQVVSVDLTGVSAGAWHHAAATYRSANSQLTLFLDGVQVFQGPAGAIAPSTGNTAPVSIGRNGGATPNFWLGRLDDVRVWNTVRTPAEIAANRLAEINGSPAGMVGNWHFDEGSGSIASDIAGDPQNAVVFGAAWVNDDPRAPPPPATPTSVATSTPTATATTAPTATRTPTPTAVATATPTSVATATPTAT